LIRFEMSIALATAATFLMMAQQRATTFAAAAFMSAFILFNRASLGAFTFPAHPGTWAILPLTWTCWFLWREKWRAALLTFFFCLLCKEEYPVAGIAAGLTMITLSAPGRRRPGVEFLGLSLLWGGLAFVLRPAFLGHSGQYTGSVKQASGLADLLQWDSLRDIAIWSVTWTLPLIPVLAFVWWTGVKPEQKFMTRESMAKNAPLIAIFVALLAIRATGGWWFSHRSVPLAATAAFLTIHLVSFSRRRTRGWNFTWAIAGILLVLTAHQSLRPALRYWQGKDMARHCPSQPSRIASLDRAVAMLLARPAGKALVQGNILPHLVERNAVHHLGATAEAPESFQWLLVEKNRLGTTWPADSGVVANTVNKWLALPGVKPVIDDENVLMLERPDLRSL
ncbi:MAG: DUF2079 domain-containing protein, partial [Proteobacteria bacterium]|nr:DUF2079 domain-containing protein [Pseudomonadota bacterium]